MIKIGEQAEQPGWPLPTDQALHGPHSRSWVVESVRTPSGNPRLPGSCLALRGSVASQQCSPAKAPLNRWQSKWPVAVGRGCRHSKSSIAVNNGFRRFCPGLERLSASSSQGDQFEAVFSRQGCADRPLVLAASPAQCPRALIRRTWSWVTKHRHQSLTQAGLKP